MTGLPADQHRAERHPSDLVALWTALAGDAVQAYQAILTLAAMPQQSVPFLHQKFRAIELPNARRLARLIADLDDQHFAIRDKATAELEHLGESARTALRQALKGKPSVEQRRRAEAILDAIDRQPLPPDKLRLLRVIETLELISTPQAQEVLKSLAKGAPEAQLTEEAKASLDRLSKRQAAEP